ncbi:hypothetical protein C2845_PM17G07970 [Panicum miliaceum]|uniref:Aminotransferase-like plant mobile domain-containing protein n=1 Tax=Panicum miliaceum TaxID=4540 RepID=A0A3L6Q3V4_PANMI|nr:hypothetical protein C2845_PM17G07970 [Panicum miliaceum]
MDVGPYREVAADHDDIDRPTKGSLWCLGKPTWVGLQRKKSNPDFVGQFDALVDQDVRWMPYTLDEIHSCAPQGMSSLCLQDQAYWIRRKPLVYDIHVEEYAVHRVMQQFYRCQASTLPYDVISVVEAEASSSMQNRMSMSPNEHLSAYKRIMQACARFRHSISCHGDDSLLPPRAGYRTSTSAPPYSATYGGGRSSFAPPTDYGVGSSARRIQDMEYTYHGATDEDETLAHTSTLEEYETASPWVETWFRQEIGGSELDGAPMNPTQASQDADAILSAMPTERPTREIVPPEPLTYSQNHTRAARAAEIPGRKGAGVWLDTEQSQQAKDHVERQGRWARERWQRTLHEEQQEEKRKKE